MAQVAKKYSTISIPGIYGSGYDQFPLGLLFNRNIQITMGQCPVKKYNEIYIIFYNGVVSSSHLMYFLLDRREWSKSYKFKKA